MQNYKLDFNASSNKAIIAKYIIFLLKMNKMNDQPELRNSMKTTTTPSILFLLSALTLWFTFDRSSY
jgi:hypothetical protein